MLIAEKGEKAEAVYQFISNMIANYPWERRGLTGALPTVKLGDILSFPFTLEQLEQTEQTEQTEQQMEEDNGKITQ